MKVEQNQQILLVEIQFVIHGVSLSIRQDDSQPERVLHLQRHQPHWENVFIIGITSSCSAWGSGQAIQQKNGSLTTGIAILNLDRMANWNFHFRGKKLENDSYHGLPIPITAMVPKRF